MEEEKDIFFDYVGPDGIQRKGEVLTIFTLEGRDHRYVLCSVPNNAGAYDIMPFILKEEADKSVTFDEILDEEEFKEVTEASKTIISDDGELGQEQPKEM